MATVTSELVTKAQAARVAARDLRKLSSYTKNAALEAIAAALETQQAILLEANAFDMQGGREAGLSDEDILDVVMITSYFGNMNRIVSGLGVKLMPEQEEKQAKIQAARDGTPA